MSSINGNQTHKIDLGPPSTRREKKEPDKIINDSKEFKEAKMTEGQKTSREIFGIQRIHDTLRRVNEQVNEKKKERKAQANKKLIKKKGKKEERKDKSDMELEDPGNDIKTDSMLSKKRMAPPIEEEDEEEESVKIDVKDKEYMDDQLENLKFSGDTEKDWKKLIKESEEEFVKLENKRTMALDPKVQSKFTLATLSTNELVMNMLAGKAPLDSPDRTLRWVLDDLKYFWNSTNENDKAYKDPACQIKCIINSLLAVVRDLVNEVNILKNIGTKQLIALKKLGEESVKLKIATDDRILQVEKPVERWLKNENNIESPEEKKLREDKRKIREAAKVVRIQKYKEEKTWIEKEDWEKMSAGLKAMYRFNFTDAHQNLTFDQWKSLNREKKNEFIERKRLFRIERKKELEELEKKDKEKAEKARRQFNFFQYRVIDRGIVCDLRGVPFQNSKYQKRY